MIHLKITALVLSCAMLAACSNGSDNADIPPSEPNASEAIELGTAVKDVIQPQSQKATDSNVLSVEWEDLVPADFKPEAIMAKYKAEIDATAEGSDAERVLYDKVMAEFNSAGPNTSLDGKTVRIPGFVAPLDTDGETVVDFLLVPYYGSCIHSPPPPANQTVMVSPVKGKSITLDQTYRPVWVVGELQAKGVTTDLAQAGYQIANARVEPYSQPTN